MRGLTKQDFAPLARWWWTLDRPFLGAVLALAALGLGLVMTASPAVANRIGVDHTHFIVRHMFFLVPALSLMFVFSFFSPQQVWRWATILGAVGVLGMLVTLVHGDEIKGATRWIHMFGFSIQPSEFVKPCFVIMAGWLLARQKTVEGFPGFLMALGLYLFLCALLLSQPDFGMTFVMTMTFFAMIFLAGCPLRVIVSLAVLGFVGLVGIYFTLDHVSTRINSFLDPQSGDSYQVDRSLEAFASGGLLGTGPGQGQIKMQIPDAHADFIFSVAAEEMGLIFLILLVALYGFIIIRGFIRLRAGNSVFAMLAGGGLLVMLGVQALIHMGSSTQLLPAKGMTLPLISYGGSSLVAIGMTFGMILALTRGHAVRRHPFHWKPSTAHEF